MDLRAPYHLREKNQSFRKAQTGKIIAKSCKDIPGLLGDLPTDFRRKLPREGLGVGWVSVLRNRDLREILGFPHRVVLVACVCFGYVAHFPSKPELEEAGWLVSTPALDLDRLPL